MGKKVAAFQIIYDSASGVYTPNQTVHGTVYIDLKEPIKARIVTLHVLGKAHTHWSCYKHTSTYSDDSGTHTRTETYPIRGHETYMNNKFVLWDGGNEKILPAGIYNFNFVFPLPYTCPPSYEGQNGYIRYYCKAKIDRPWKFDKAVMSGFTVLPHFDLNALPNAASSLVKDFSKNLGFISKHGMLNVRAILPKVGYVPGENINIHLEFLNESSRKIDSIAAKLVQFTSYEGTCTHSSHLARKHQDRTVAKMRKESKIPAKTSGSEVLSVQVPSIVPTFNNCSIIQVNYILEVKVDAHGFVNNSITFAFPILIGTYPIVKQHINPLAYPMPTSDYIAPPQPTAPPSGITGPPSLYAECMFGQGTMALEDEDTKHAGNIGFAPRYLFYNKKNIK